MIQELLLKTIEEVQISNFKIVEFQLGKNAYEILKKEIEGVVSNYTVDISKINKFMNIPVTLHKNDDAVMYCLSFKK